MPTSRQTNKNALKSHVWFKWDQDKGRRVSVQKEPGFVAMPTFVKQPVGMPKLLSRLKKSEVGSSLVYEMATRTFMDVWPDVKLRGSLTHDRSGITGSD